MTDTSKPLTFMNESILLEAFLKIRDEFNSEIKQLRKQKFEPLRLNGYHDCVNDFYLIVKDLFQIDLSNPEAIKKWEQLKDQPTYDEFDENIRTPFVKKLEDSSGKETGMKWVKASELPQSEKSLPDVVVTQMPNGSVFAYDTKKNIKGLREILKHNPNIKIFLLNKSDESVQPYKEEVDKERRFTLNDMLNCFAFGRECEYAEHFGAVPNRCTKEIYFKREFNINLKSKEEAGEDHEK